MSGAIAGEAGFWLYAAALGVQLLFLYDLLRIFRRVFPHKAAAVGIEDFCYWMAAGVLIFHMLYRFNYGIIRWFAGFGMLTGMLLYHLTVSRLFVKYMTKWLRALAGAVKRPLNILFKKIQSVLTFITRIHKKFTIFLKKKLKMVKKNCSIKNKNVSRGVPVVEAKKKEKSKTTE